MFFKGSLQEGIAAALQQSKHVICFVTDEGGESQQWENEFLADNSVKNSIESQAVALRLVDGTEEAGFLEALFPVPRKPTLVVIQNGQLREYIAQGTSKDAFVRRLGSALVDPSRAAPTTQTSAPQDTLQNQPAPSSNMTMSTTVDDTDELYGQYVPALNNPASSSTPGTNAAENPHVQALLAERAQRLEADQKEKEAQAKAEKEAKAKERREAAATERPATAESSYAQQIKKRKQEEKEERQRILKRIEDDKRARKERDAQERQARLLLNATSEANSPTLAGVSEPPIPLNNRYGGPNCNLQVRLFDGSTMRTTFPSDVTLQSEVRKWVDKHRTDGDLPYTFRIVLTPLPNKTVDPADESSTLLELGLAPSATLVLVPVIRFAAAYAQASGNAFWRGWAMIYAMIIWLFNLPADLFRGRGTGNSNEQQEEFPLQDLDGAGSRRNRIRGFENSDNRRDQQFYNGNSLSFEPRRDEDETNG